MTSRVNTVPREPMCLRGTVRHMRFYKRRNGFNYRTWYVGLPVFSARPSCAFIAYNTSGIVSVHHKDYADKGRTPLPEYLKDLLGKVAPNNTYDLDAVFLVTMPRVLGYMFNPVSFWYIPDHQGALRAVLCEVHNTFDEVHSYICAKEDGGVIQSDTTLRAQKVFHVSPFFDRSGGYRFRFILNNRRLGVFIVYIGDNGKVRLTASLHGVLVPLTSRNLLREMAVNPHPSLKTTFLIYWQAAILWIRKRISYIAKPKQAEERATRAS